MKKINAKIPKLRFPVFDGEWGKNEFDNLVQRSKAKFNPTIDPTIYPCIELESLSQETGILLKVFNSTETKSLKNKFSNGQILFGKLRPYLKKFLKAPFDGVCSSEIWVLYGTKLTNDFLYYLIQLETFNCVVNVTSGSKMPRADWEFLSTSLFYFTTLTEQKKIASFLITVDKKITQLTKKKELLERYKKGVMQKIFSQEIRFKDDDGGDFPDWEEKRLGELITDFKGGASLTPSDFISSPGCEVIPKKAIVSGGTLIFDRLSPTYCKVAVLDSNKGSLIDNSFLVTTLRDLVPSGPNIGYIVQFQDEGKYILAQGVYALKIDCTQLIQKYLIQFSNTIKYRKIMQTIMVGSTQVHVRNKDFMNIKILTPTIPEQKKISSFLTTIDKKIKQVTTQIEKTNAFKKGLLQQMFV